MRLALSCVLLLLLDLADITSCGKKLSGTRRNRNLLATVRIFVVVPDY